MEHHAQGVKQSGAYENPCEEYKSTGTIDSLERFIYGAAATHTPLYSTISLAMD